MRKETSSDLFIRLLTEACDADRAMRNFNLSAQHKISAEKFRRRQQSDLDHFLRASQPLDCVQLMATG